MKKIKKYKGLTWKDLGHFIFFSQNFDFFACLSQNVLNSFYISMWSFPKYQTKKTQEFRHILIYSIVSVTSAAFIAPIPKIFVIKVAILQLESVRYQQRHNLLAYMMYIRSILSLQCIIGRLSTLAIFVCFVSGRDLVAVFWSIFLVIKAKQDQSGSFSLFNLLCEWFFDWLLEKIEVIGQTGWEWKLYV